MSTSIVAVTTFFLQMAELELLLWPLGLITIFLLLAWMWGAPIYLLSALGLIAAAAASNYSNRKTLRLTGFIFFSLPVGFICGLLLFSGAQGAVSTLTQTKLVIPDFVFSHASTHNVFIFKDRIAPSVIKESSLREFYTYTPKRDTDGYVLPDPLPSRFTRWSVRYAPEKRCPPGVRYPEHIPPELKMCITGTDNVRAPRNGLHIWEYYPPSQSKYIRFEERVAGELMRFSTWGNGYSKQRDLAQNRRLVHEENVEYVLRRIAKEQLKKR
ncbi:MAG: hypothetical protein AAFW83_09860 [Pseudomonadota bacterium]